jgi:hypothetical protein
MWSSAALIVASDSVSPLLHVRNDRTTAAQCSDDSIDPMLTAVPSALDPVRNVDLDVEGESRLARPEPGDVTIG